VPEGFLIGLLTTGLPLVVGGFLAGLFTYWFERRRIRLERSERRGVLLESRFVTRSISLDTLSSEAVADKRGGCGAASPLAVGSIVATGD